MLLSAKEIRLIEPDVTESEFSEVPEYESLCGAELVDTLDLEPSTLEGAELAETEAENKDIGGWMSSKRR